MSKQIPSMKEVELVLAKAEVLIKQKLTRKEIAKRLNMTEKTLRLYLNTYSLELKKVSVPNQLRARLLNGPAKRGELLIRLGLTPVELNKAITELERSNVSVLQHGDTLEISRAPTPQNFIGKIPVYTSRPNGEYVFGFTSDNHLGSKYERIDVLEALYTEFENAGVDRVFNAGNWIDGEARFNKFDIHVYGMENQVDHFVDKYPQRDGIITYAVAGDDHEGWYCQREGIDIGAFAQSKMEKAGRHDFKYLGYMEAFVKLQHANSLVSNMLHLLHPGGGSAYADSYTVQKIVEAYEGGEKPAVLLAGHYHKLGYNYIRNVHAIQTGCTQDLTPFARKKKLRYAVGGGICRLKQDPTNGAIISCTVEIFGYFNKGFYNDRWSMSGSIVLPQRVLNRN